MESKPQKRKNSFDGSKKKSKSPKEQKPNKKREVTVTPSEPKESSKRPEKKLKTTDEDLPRGGFFRPAPPQNQQEEPATSSSQSNLFKFENKALGLKKTIKPKKKLSKKEAKQAEEMDVELASVIQILKIQTLNVGVKTLGVVSGFDGDQINVDLPNHLKGFIEITEISDELNVRIEKEIDVFKATTVNLKDYFRIGDIVRCVVSDLTDNDENKKRISLSLRPSAFNQGLEIDSIVEGSLLRGTVKSVEDHGCIINTGIPQVEGFVKKEKNFLDHYVVGMPVDLHVTSVNKDAKIISLTANPALFKKTFTNTAATVQTVSPGQLVEAEIFDASSKGIFLRFLDDLIGTVYFPDLDMSHPMDIPETYKTETKVKARVLWVDNETHSFALTLKKHFVNWDKLAEVPEGVVGTVSEVTITYPFGRGVMVQMANEQEGYVSVDHLELPSPDPKTIAEVYPVGKIVTGRVMSWDNFNQIPALTLKPKEIQQPYFSFKDISAGDIIEGEVFDMQNDYVRVKLSEFVTGICYNLHWSDSNLKNPDKKFKAGKKSRFRVIKVDPRNRRLILTAKPSIIDCTGVIPSDYNTLNAGDVVSGWVVKVGAFGLLMSFLEDVTAVVLKSDLNIDSDDHTKFFHLGQVLQCRVVNVNLEKSKLRVSLNLSESASTNYTPGEKISAKIVQVDKSKKILRIEFPNKEKASINFSQLSEFHSEKIPGNFTVNSTIDVLVLNERGHVTAKPLLLENSDKIPKTFEEVKVGEIYYGSAEAAPKFGTIVKFHGNLHGFDPATREVLERGQTVKFQVDAKDEAKRRIKGHIGGCKWDHKLLLEQYYKEEDMLNSNKNDWKKFSIGGVVEVTVKDVQEFGVTLDTPVKGVNAFALVQNAPEVKVGDKLKARILDIDYEKNVLDVSLVPEFVQVKTEKLGKVNEGTVKLVKKNILVLSLQNDKCIGFALSKDLNENVDAFATYVVGQKVNVEVKGVYNGIHERNLLQVVKNVEKKKKNTPKKQ